MLPLSPVNEPFHDPLRICAARHQPGFPCGKVEFIEVYHSVCNLSSNILVILSNKRREIPKIADWSVKYVLYHVYIPARQVHLHGVSSPPSRGFRSLLHGLSGPPSRSFRSTILKLCSQYERTFRALRLRKLYISARETHLHGLLGPPNTEK